MEVWEVLFILVVGIQASLVIEGRPSGSESETSSDAAYLEADQFLTSYGYYPSHGLLPAKMRKPSLRKHSDIERTNAVKLFQKFYNLPQSGELDKETRKLMQSPRCGNADIISHPSIAGIRVGLNEEEDANQTQKENTMHDNEEAGINVERGRRSLNMSRKRRVKRYNIFRDKDGNHFKWKEDKMTWHIIQYPFKDIPTNDQRLTMEHALMVWGRLLPFKLVEDPRVYQAFDDAQILMWFHSFGRDYQDNQYHRGSNWINQGESKKNLSHGRLKRTTSTKREETSLSHISYPKSRSEGTSWKRYIHFNQDHKWTHVELLAVTLHEIGHAVGLGHSTDPNAVMYPYNRNVTSFALDDLEGLAVIYSTKNNVLRSHLCTARLNKVDAIFPDPNNTKDWNQKYYVISGNKVQQLVPSLPRIIFPQKPIDEVFPGAPAKYDVVFAHPETNSVIFINGNMLYQYKNNKPLPPKRIGFPETPTFAFNLAVGTGAGKGVITMLFSELGSWQFVFDGEKVRIPELKSHKRRTWKNLLHTKFAVQWTDGRVYVVKRYGSSLSLRFGKRSRPGQLRFFRRSRNQPKWMRAILCRGGHATCLRMSGSNLVLVIILSLIKLY